MSDTQSPEKDAPSNEHEKEPAKPAQDTNAAETVWSDDVLEWAIASSTCGGLPRKDEAEPDSGNAAAQDKSDKPACP